MALPQGLAGAIRSVRHVRVQLLVAVSHVDSAQSTCTCNQGYFRDTSSDQCSTLHSAVLNQLYDMRLSRVASKLSSF